VPKVSPLIWVALLALVAWEFIKWPFTATYAWIKDKLSFKRKSD
jgi:hypothetical protein